MDPTHVLHLVSRQDTSALPSATIDTGNPQVNTLLDLIANPFDSTVRSLIPSSYTSGD